jgi:hypothetical protein
MREWHSVASPILSALMKAEDAVLATLEHPGVALSAACDQLLAAADHCEEWLYEHPCPDRTFGWYFDQLIRECSAIGAMVGSGVYVDPAYREKVDAFLTDCISTGAFARAGLRQRDGW